MEQRQRQSILQGAARGTTHPEIQEGLNEHFGLRASKGTAVCRGTALPRLRETSADDAERPWPPCEEGIDFSVLRSLDENPSSSVREMARKPGVAQATVSHHLRGSLRMTYVTRDWFRTTSAHKTGSTVLRCQKQC
jgi:hypothetical protein